MQSHEPDNRRLLNYITRKMPRKERIRWRAVMSHDEAVMSHEEDAAERKGFGGEREMCATPSGFMNQASSDAEKVDIIKFLS